jgi:hypothetical protein
MIYLTYIMNCWFIKNIAKKNPISFLLKWDSKIIKLLPFQRAMEFDF